MSSYSQQGHNNLQSFKLELMPMYVNTPDSAAVRNGPDTIMVVVTVVCLCLGVFEGWLFLVSQNSKCSQLLAVVVLAFAVSRVIEILIIVLGYKLATSKQIMISAVVNLVFVVAGCVVVYRCDASSCTKLLQVYLDVMLALSFVFWAVCLFRAAAVGSKQ
eukprot:c15236_g1_i1.p1 GENE.c15236_g1_i1~~c15236_g1_i1.p1  ORF type:complete len:160 (-),score=36.51 c15236_g1_i1:78-557(-)